MLVLMAIEDMLADLGCESVAVAGSLEKALQLVGTNSFDLATIDVNLNGERSYPVARALAEQGVPFAFSTGYGEHGVAEGFGHYPVLNKPFDHPQLIRVLTQLLTEGHPPAISA